MALLHRERACLIRMLPEETTACIKTRIGTHNLQERKPRKCTLQYLKHRPQLQVDQVFLSFSKYHTNFPNHLSQWKAQRVEIQKKKNSKPIMKISHFEDTQ